MTRLGLTGSIGMGKTTTAGLFAQEGARVYDADAVVHGLYGRGGKAVAALARAFEGVVCDGAVDRERLSAAVFGDAVALRRLEAIVHPLVAEDRARFLDQARDAVDVVVFDVPLLFETGGDREVDAVVVVSCSALLQRTRVLARAGMTPERLKAILARQWPDALKRERADFVIDTGRGLAAARGDVQAVLARVRQGGFASLRPLAPGLDGGGGAPQESPDGA